MALDMQLWFRRKISKMPKSPNEDWILNLRKITDHLNSVLDAPPLIKNH